jgi:hypothetical protein
MKCDITKVTCEQQLGRNITLSSEWSAQFLCYCQLTNGASKTQNNLNEEIKKIGLLSGLQREFLTLIVRWVFFLNLKALKTLKTTLKINIFVMFE